MHSLLRRFALQLVAVLVTSQLITGLHIENGWYGLISASFLLFIILSIIKPILHVLLFPLHLITLNLSLWIVHIALIFLWILLAPSVVLTAWEFPGITIGAVVIAAQSFSPLAVGLISSIFLQFLLQLMDWIFS